MTNPPRGIIATGSVFQSIRWAFPPRNAGDVNVFGAFIALTLGENVNLRPESTGSTKIEAKTEECSEQFLTMESKIVVSLRIIERRAG